MTFSLAQVFLLLPFVYIAAVSVPLTVIDVREHRLPNTFVLPGYAVIALGLVGYCVFSLLNNHLPRDVTEQVWPFVGQVSLCALGYFGFLLLLSWLGGMGMGDVKLAGVLGGTAAILGLTTAISAVLIAFALGGLVSLAVVIVRRTRKARIPFGPFMLAGFWISVTMMLVSAQLI